MTIFLGVIFIVSTASLFGMLWFRAWEIKNREKAFQILKAKVYEDAIQKQEAKNDSERKNKIGTGDRSEKIRTYNYPQNRLTDHRIGYTSMNLDRVVEGKIGDLIEALIAEDQKRKLEVR